MTAFDIYSAIGNVSEELLEESELFPKRIMPKGILYMTAAAACFAVLAVGLRFAFNDSGIAAPEQGELLTAIVETYPVTADVTQYTSPQTTETTRSVTSCGLETAVVPKWEDMSDLERYSYLDYNGATYSMTVKTFDESELTFLQNGELYGFEEGYCEPCDSEGDMKHYSAPCAFYKIKNVNENYMIAAFTADGNYTAFQNSRYRPDTLGDYIKDIDFSNRYKLTTILSETHTLVGDAGDELETHHFEYDLPDLQQAVEKLLAENSDVVPTINPPSVMDRYLIICGDDTFPTVRICNAGYIGVLGKYFKIGMDKTKSFTEYVEENAVKTEYYLLTTDDAIETIPE